MELATPKTEVENILLMSEIQEMGPVVRQTRPDSRITASIIAYVIVKKFLIIVVQVQEESSFQHLKHITDL